MRFAGAWSILAFGAGSAAIAQEATEKDPKIEDLQRQLAAIQAQLDRMQAESAAKSQTAAPSLDGPVRSSPATPAAEPRRLNISAPGIEGIDLYGGIVMRGDYWGNYNGGAGADDILSGGTEAWLGARAKISEKTSASITLHYANVWGNNTFGGLDGSSTGRLTGTPAGTPASNNSNNPNVSVTEALIQVRDLYDQGIDLTLGRQKLEYGAERIIGDDEWRLNRTVFDGFRFDQTLGPDFGKWSLIAMRLQDNDNAISSELGPSGGGSVNDNADLFGIYYTMKRNEIGTIDAYIFYLDDMNYGATSDPAVGRTRLTTYGARWLSPSFGGFTIDGEGVTQFGELFGNRTENYGFGTYAMHLGGAWRPEQKIEYLDSVHASYDYATGGSSPEDNFVQLYPSLHGWFGITDLFSWTNIEHFTLGAATRIKEGTLDLSYHWMRMAGHHGGFVGYNASGGSTATSNNRDLGQEIDAVYMVDCTKMTKVGLGLGYFFDGRGYRQMQGGGNDMVFAYMTFRVTF